MYLLFHKKDVYRNTKLKETYRNNMLKYYINHNA
jgi:hypothetical protein